MGGGGGKKSFRPVSRSPPPVPPTFPWLAKKLSRHGEGATLSHASPESKPAKNASKPTRGREIGALGFMNRPPSHARSQERDVDASTHDLSLFFIGSARQGPRSCKIRCDALIPCYIGNELLGQTRRTLILLFARCLVMTDSSLRRLSPS